MKRILIACLALAALALNSCGSKSSESASGSASSSPPPAASAPASGGVAAVSQYDSGPRAGESAIDASKVPVGEKLFKDKGCSACHAFGKRITCPDLQGVTMRRTAAWMEHQILHPDVMVKTDPIAHDLFAKFALQMPNQGLTADQADQVIEYFKHMDHEAGLTRPAASK
jgi:mono/diheme cytochrome c family protein